ncbi:hypothetical protein ACU686_25600 [Yinghuangia aomiensis]
MPGSLKVPPGWTAGWSTDGSTFGTADTGAATTAVRAQNSLALAGGTSLATLALGPVKPTPQPTGGDGFTPVPAPDRERRDRVVEHLPPRRAHRAAGRLHQPDGSVSRARAAPGRVRSTPRPDRSAAAPPATSAAR